MQIHSSCRKLFTQTIGAMEILVACGASLVAVLGLTVIDVEASDRSKPSEQSLELVETVIAGIESNNSQIRTLEATVEVVSRDSRVEKEEIKTVKSPDGKTTIHFRMTPKTTSRWKCYIDRDKVRQDTICLETQQKQTLALLDGVWTQYVPGSKTAWVRRVDDMPGMFPVDLRELGSPELKMSVEDILRQNDIISARIEHPAGDKSVIRVVTGGPAEYEWEFSAAFNFLPTSRISRHEDGSILQLVRIAYQRILDGAAWFPLERSRSFFAKGVTATPSDDGWRQHSTLRITDIVMINEPIDEKLFVLDLPDGTRIRDGVARETYFVGQPRRAEIKPASASERKRRWLVAIISSLAILVVVAFAVKYRRSANRSP